MKYRILKSVCTALFFAGLTSTQALADSETSIPYKIEVKQFNSLASDYLGAPTFVAIKEKSKYDQLLLRVDLIKKSKLSQDSGASYENLVFSEKKGRFEDTIDAIDKYLKWHDIAMADGDIFTKKIGFVKYNSSSQNKFEFRSGNAQNHYLVITKYSFANSLSTDYTNPKERNQEPEFVFDHENALRLKELLLEWRDGGFEERLSVDIDDKYK